MGGLLGRDSAWALAVDQRSCQNRDDFSLCHKKSVYICGMLLCDMQLDSDYLNPGFRVLASVGGCQIPSLSGAAAYGQRKPARCHWGAQAYDRVWAFKAFCVLQVLGSWVKGYRQEPREEGS